MEEKHFCEYGCQTEAHYQMKNGKWCCSVSCSSCRGMRLKNSGTNKGRKQNWKNGHPKGFTGKKAWNSGLTKDIDPRVKAFGETFKQHLANGAVKHAWLGRHHSEETKRKLVNNGGYRAKGGRGKRGWYQGFYCDSSWELAWIIYQLEHGIKFERNNRGFEYEFEGKKFKYYPDFRLEDGSYVEVKGWLDAKNKAKIASFQGSLTVLGKNEIKPYLDYAIVKYGKDFIKLYGR